LADNHTPAGQLLGPTLG